MLKTEPQALIENKQASVRVLYDRHASTLLGYLFEIVKDRNLAEEYLVKIFCDVSQHFNEINWDDTNSWCQLQRFAKNKISQLINSGNLVKDSDIHRFVNPADSHHKYPDLFSEEQHQIFYGVYYYGKSIEEISKELNKTEESTRKALKEAFTIMRNSCEN
ncbi:DNA-directed RNA polymerase specialized sigma24 family protein [Pedobacter cryoconitis]|uniref:DNA-directed RNA polymerase specialized sigma24 family protein n=1 Tax=Pedobacter cryoconitis TaxID=188932 RepID=A0A7W8ZN27_9SPHI|nr:sigma-70 family RNA polymerase sigma factor [Pedobacter cryoconitis]MBB5636935.1 DNA-directed RNA polymerase specialized sigma24 family protein [Pedobacter cryoconitis]MBB6271336.1 DNA-directed RNA polymerase specialized sigma24 family protein [Pedobacter cryoconitis]